MNSTLKKIYADDIKQLTSQNQKCHEKFQKS